MPIRRRSVSSTCIPSTLPAVAMQEQGLIYGNQYAMWLGPIGYHDYEGLISTDEEGQRLAKISAISRCAATRHGFVLWGHSISRSVHAGLPGHPRLRDAGAFAGRRA